MKGRGLFLLPGVGGYFRNFTFFPKETMCSLQCLIPAVLFLRRAMNPAALAVIKCPGFHYADHRLEITKHDADYTNVERQEFSIARHSPMV